MGTTSGDHSLITYYIKAHSVQLNINPNQSDWPCRCVWSVFISFQLKHCIFMLLCRSFQDCIVPGLDFALNPIISLYVIVLKASIKHPTHSHHKYGGKPDSLLYTSGQWIIFSNRHKISQRTHSSMAGLIHYLSQPMQSSSGTKSYSEWPLSAAPVCRQFSQSPGVGCPSPIQ